MVTARPRGILARDTRGRTHRFHGLTRGLLKLHHDSFAWHPVAALVSGFIALGSGFVLYVGIRRAWVGDPASILSSTYREFYLGAAAVFGVAFMTLYFSLKSRKKESAVESLASKAAVQAVERGMTQTSTGVSVTSSAAAALESRTGRSVESRLAGLIPWRYVGLAGLGTVAVGGAGDLSGFYAAYKDPSLVFGTSGHSITALMNFAWTELYSNAVAVGGYVLYKLPTWVLGSRRSAPARLPRVALPAR